MGPVQDRPWPTGWRDEPAKRGRFPSSHHPQLPLPLIPLQILRKQQEALEIASFELVRVDGLPRPDFSARGLQVTAPGAAGLPTPW